MSNKPLLKNPYLGTMAFLLIKNIKTLVNTREKPQVLRGKELSELPCIDNAFLLVHDEKIEAYGSMDELPTTLLSLSLNENEESLPAFDASGRLVLPAWCDSHTHLVFAASREGEFIDKIKGLSYAEIAAKGGGILNSANKLNQTPEDELYEKAVQRLNELISLGTGAIEIKSGYGLSLEGELKMLRIIKRLKESSPILVRSTFLGAHARPVAYRENQEGYIRLIIDEMLPAISKEGLADYIDVFCENGFFSVTETERICEAGMEYGLRPKLHVNQLNSIGGVQAGIRLNALSLDHLETMTKDDIRDLAQSNCIGTLLPGPAFFLRMPMQPARELIDAGAAVALASDFNPGSCPSGNMNLVVSMACIQMRMLPEEAVNAATVNGAYAMGVEEQVGSITKGKLANFILTKPVSSLAYLPYAFGQNNVDKLMIRGKWI